ncbi:MAG: U32 family peptidase [Candidatus Cryptobacteroides sp.]
MKFLELLAPARNMDIGIAAIDCGADAVYIAGPAFGARQAAGNSIEDIRTLCSYAHRYGARVFITLNTIVFDSELEDIHEMMLSVEDAGADAIIVQDLALLKLAGGGIPLHASTQCAIRDKDKALLYRDLGFSRIVLEREMSLESIREISEATGSEIEFFVHGALCVCYSGQCYLSEAISGRSANRGQCIQACRSLYDLVDGDGNVLVRNKALLSLKDYNLLHRLGDLADAGVTSFKIEGRLKNISYVKNVVRAYSTALDDLVASRPEQYARASRGVVRGGFRPDLNKTFNRGYTELFIDGKRGRWSSMDAPKGMGEIIGTVKSISPAGRNGIMIEVSLNKAGLASPLGNGDGFAFISGNGIIAGFRGDVCSGNTIRCQKVDGLSRGTTLYRNLNTGFEKAIESAACRRMIRVNVNVDASRSGDGHFTLACTAMSEDGRKVSVSTDAGNEAAGNRDRMKGLMESQLGKSSGIYEFTVASVSPGELPFASASFLNNIRRTLAEELDKLPCIGTPMAGKPSESGTRQAQEGLTEYHSYLNHKDLDYKFNIANHLSRSVYTSLGAGRTDNAFEISHTKGVELMRTKYCIRYELGLCPVHQKGSTPAREPLQLINNGRRLTLHFDCGKCEMTVTG